MRIQLSQIISIIFCDILLGLVGKCLKINAFVLAEMVNTNVMYMFTGKRFQKCKKKQVVCYMHTSILFIIHSSVAEEVSGL